MDIKERLDKYMDALEGLAAKGGDFLASEVPEVCRELIAWQFWSSVCCVISMLVASMVALLVARFLWRSRNKEDDFADENFSSVEVALLFIVSACFLFGGAVYQSSQALKAHVAPRVVLLETIKELVKK